MLYRCSINQKESSSVSKVERWLYWSTSGASK